MTTPITLKSGMLSYAETATDVAPPSTNGAQAPTQRPESRKRWILNAFDMACAGHQSPGLWKAPGDRSAEYHDVEYWTDLAKILEKGKFNGLFVADTLGAYDVYGGGLAGAARTGAQWGVDDPTLMVSAAAAVTKNLTFGITHSVTYEAPYTLARRFSTLDHLTKGRVAFNLVTSYLDSAARNFGLKEQIEHDERYARANEYMNVLYKLWESSWRDDAVVLDKARDLYADPARIRKVHHKGKYFDVEGPGFVEPSPQGSPVIFQAGSSKAGIEFGARHAEAVFMSGPSPQKLRVQVDALRAAAVKEGRDPFSIKVLLKILVIVDETDEKAQAKKDELYKLASTEGAKVLFGGWIGEDLAAYSADQDLREHGSTPVKNIARGYSNLFPEVKLWNADALADHIKLGGMGPLIVGGPTKVADELQKWLDDSDADGFNLCYAVTPGTFEDIVEHLVPELQRRGVHWKDYPQREDGKGITAREGLYGAGQTKFRDDHYGSRFKWKAGQEVPPELDPAGGILADRVEEHGHANGNGVKRAGEEAVATNGDAKKAKKSAGAWGEAGQFSIEDADKNGRSTKF